MKASSSPPDHSAGAVVDVIFDAGIFYLELANIGSQPVTEIACSFHPDLHDLHDRSVNGLALFTSTMFLMPGKRIRTILDTSASYFARKGPKTISVTIGYTDWTGQRHNSKVVHNLAIYQGLNYLTAQSRA